MNPIQLFNIPEIKKCELSILLNPKTGIKHNEDVYQMSCTHKIERWPTTGELIIEIMDNIDISFDNLLPKKRCVIYPFDKKTGRSIQDHALWFSGDTIYECLIKAVCWIRSQK